MRRTALCIATVLALAACGGDDGEGEDGADGDAPVVPEGATLCSVATDDYFPILASPTPFGEDGWEAEAAELVDLARILEQLAPADQVSNAADNVGYFEALAAVESAAEYIPGSNDFNAYLRTTC